MSWPLESRRFLALLGRAPFRSLLSIVADEPAPPIGAHHLDQCHEVLPLLCQGVFHFRGDFGERLALDDAVVFERVESLGDGFMADSVQRAL